MHDRARRHTSAVLATTLIGLLPTTFLGALPASAADEVPAFDAVNLFIGTELDTTQNKSNDAYGNTYPGAAVPFGMVQPSPTTYKTDEDNDLVREKGGYEYTADQIRGFGMTRYSGSGCHGRFGGYEFPTTPFAGALSDDGTLPHSPAVDHRSYFLNFSHDDELAQPGYYAVTTDNGVQTELTATTRTGVSRFDFPADGDATLLVNASGANNRVHDVVVEIDPETRTVSGEMYGADLCDDGTHYRAYFSTTYDQPFESYGVWDGAEMTAGGTAAERITGDTGADHRQQVGAWLTFADGAEVTARTGFSYVSVENAAANREAESEGKSFDDVRAEARASWEDALGLIDVAGGSDEQRVKFYTALYHSLLHPNIRQDVDGRYRGVDDEIHTVTQGRNHYVNFAGGGWDMVRSQAQLIGMLYPDVARDINQSILDQVEQYGGWPAFRGVDSLQNLVGTLDAFGATDYDREGALASMVETQALPSDRSHRFNAFQYFATGMIENGKGGDATSRVLDHAVTDFAIAQLADRLGDEEAYNRFMVRAQSWQNVFDPETGHIRPRSRHGFDRGFDLRDRGNQFHQSTGYQWGWHVQHNLGSLIDMRGGPAAAEADLDVLMEELDAGAYTKTGNYLSNQPAMSTPWVYNWLGKPHKATDVLYRAVDEMYDTTPSGLPGNDDQGSLSSWYIFANLGIAPVVYGTANLVVTAPMFDEIRITSADDDDERTYEIHAPGVSDGARYTTGLSVDGEARSASWLDESFARDGGRLDFEMSDTPGDWGTGTEDVPPSWTDGSDARNNVGTVPHGATLMGSMDLSDWAFSRDSLEAAGAAPGEQIPHGDTGIVFTWPETEPGEPDNWIPHGQRIELEPQQAAAISFLGLATNGPSRGNAVVEYSDGSTQSVHVELTDWAQQPGGGNSTLLGISGRVNASGSIGGGEFRVFGTRPAALDPEKTVEAVILPEGTDRGIMHIFDVAVTDQEYVDPDAPAGNPERIVLTATEEPSTSQYVTWRSRSALPLAGKVELRTANGGDTVTVEAEQKPERAIGGYAARSHSALLEGLEPGMEYQYRVSSGNNWSAWYSFTTASAEAEPFTFLYFGDAQEGIDSVWHHTVDAAVEAHPDAELALFAGDLVNNGSSDREWTDWFAGVEGVVESINALAVLGNHEIGGQPFIENFIDSFEYDPNGPVAADAAEYAADYGDHLAGVLKDTVYVTDYQGVRFVNLNANRDDICPIAEPPGLASYNCDTARRAWMTMQANWLDRVLRENPHGWSVVQEHQPIFSNAQGRNEADWRQYILPIIERNNVDLVLQGHDHTYGRGYHGSTGSDMEGVTAGPVYVVANAGQKQYTLTGEDNVWTQNGAVPVVRAQDTSTYQAITVDDDTLTFESVVTHTRDGGAAESEVGDVLDSFTITKRDDGAKWVTEAGAEVPDETVDPVNIDRPTNEPFDDASYGDVAWDDDFTTDRLSEYIAHGDSAESAAELSVDTDAGVLEATADGRRWSHVALPLEAGESFALIVEPADFTGTGAAEDSLFIGLTDGIGNRAHSWFNNSRSESGIDVVVDGSAQGLSAGPGPLAVSWEPGDRLATVVDHGELTSWIEKDGEWQRIRSGLLSLTMSEKQITGWAPTFSLRLDPGTIAIDRITLLRREADGTPPDACPDGYSPEETVAFDGVDSGVGNVERGDGCTILDLIWAEAPFANHGAFVRQVTAVADRFRADGLITARERSAIVRAAAQSRAVDISARR
ncbi:GH92 family glycosyl hydrolase [Phytoactinopolyspora halotolerans]|uniref:Alpha-mannosidase n=1 Tax=Phytoactinopolyspora halotolerans TaxID=1981512 RepID=A0A6L9S3Y8_9ACTN|nr:GH92 family glycosyl hydrolase [Phytoactinopolyspora halotolerans]NED99772.1 alpha-mannosidase [Phytoactinopolyspora halotolerans]